MLLFSLKSNPEAEFSLATLTTAADAPFMVMNLPACGLIPL
jgi:hypothetical protein